MIQEDTVRQLPAIDPRVETGPTRFGDDFTGLFIRGDNALYFAKVLEVVIDGFFGPGSPGEEWQIAAVRQLQRLLASVDERQHTKE